MLTILQAVILGAIQGATEFLPVSSSGHLVLGAKILDIPTNLAAETLLNIGTILVIAVYFWPQIKSAVSDVLGPGLKLKERLESTAKLAIGVMPAVLVGILFGDFIEKNLHSVGAVVIMLITIGIAMIFTKPKFGRTPKQTKDVLKNISYRQAAIVGLAQPIALISGSSRSGITILAGLWSGLDIKTSAAYSFLIGLPVIAGATLKFMVSSEGRDFLSSNAPAFIAGNIASFAVGFVAVGLLMKVVTKHGLKPFGTYRIILAILVILFVI